MEISRRTRSQVGVDNVTKGDAKSADTRRALGRHRTLNKVVQKGKSLNVVKPRVEGQQAQLTRRRSKRTARQPTEEQAICAKPAVEIVHPEYEGLERELHCVEFMDDVYRYLLHAEGKTDLPQNFMEFARGCTPKMRSILVDWLCQVHQRFDMKPETFHLAVYIVDVVLSTTQIAKSELQLLGVSAMLVAAKYEEMCAPEISEFEYVSDNAFNKKEILRMEQKVLVIMGFELSRPHSLIFLRFVGEQLSAIPRALNMAKYFGEICLLEYSVAHHHPSRIAAAGLVLGYYMMNRQAELDIKTLLKLIEGSAEEMDEIVRDVARAVLKMHTQTKLTSVKQKYAVSKFVGASTLSADEVARLTKLCQSE